MQGSTGTDLINLSSNNEGVCLHNYSLLPSDMATIDSSDVFLTCGDDITSSVEISNKVDVSQGYSDPEHLWMNLDGAMSMANTIANTLAEKDWKNKTTYLENADKFVEQARTQEALIKTKVDALSQKNILSLDGALSVFASGIGLSVVGDTGDDHEVDGTVDTSHVSEYIDAVDNNNINTIIVPQENANSPLLSIITNELSNENRQMNVLPLSSVLSGDNSANDYFTQISNDFDNVYNALKDDSAPTILP